MADHAPDPTPTTVRPYDAIERVIVFGEQLEIAMELVAAGTLAKARLALVAVDNLADVLLHRHAERVFDSTEGSWWCRRRRYSNDERERIRKSFARMLKLAQSRADAPFGRHVDPILSASDAATFRVAHNYRNGVYHEDRHNPAVLGPLVVLYAEAVGRAFVLGYRVGVAHSVAAGQLDELRRLGYAGTTHDGFTSTSMYDFREGAGQIVDYLLGDFEVSLADLRAYLAADIDERAHSCARAVVALQDDGMPDDRLEFAFTWSQFWEAHGSDPEWQRLDTLRFELDAAAEHAADDATRADYEAREREAHEAHIARAHELQRTYTPPVRWWDPPRFARLAESLGRARDMSSLVTRYEQLDLEMEQLERATSAAASAWAAICEQAFQASREG